MQVKLSNIFHNGTFLKVRCMQDFGLLSVQLKTHFTNGGCLIKIRNCFPFSSTWALPPIGLCCSFVFSFLCCVLFFILLVFVLCLVCPVLRYQFHCIVHLMISLSVSLSFIHCTTNYVYLHYADYKQVIVYNRFQNCCYHQYGLIKVL
jgi:hypothetical protein